MQQNDLLQRLSELITTVPAREANGIHLVAAEPDSVTNEMEIMPFHRNIHGILHGGYILLLADCAAGLTAYTDGRSYVTQSQNFNFLRSVASGTVRATGKVVHRGRTVVVVRVQVTDEAGRLLGDGTFNMFVVGQGQA